MNSNQNVQNLHSTSTAVTVHTIDLGNEMVYDEIVYEQTIYYAARCADEVTKEKDLGLSSRNERGWYWHVCSRWNSCPAHLSFLSKPRAHRQMLPPQPSTPQRDRRRQLRVYRRRRSG